MAKRLINTFTNLDLSIDEHKVKLGEIKDGELVVQSSKSKELKIWGKTLGGEIVSVPTTEDVADIVNEKLKDIDIDLSEYAKKDNVYGKSEVYTKNEVDEIIENIDLPTTELTNYYTKEEVDEIIENIDHPTTDLSDYYTKTEVDKLIENVEISEEQLNGFVKNEDLDSYKNEVSKTINEKVDKSTLENYYTKSEVNGLISSTGSYGMMVLPEDVYRQLEIRGRVTYNGEVIEYNDNVMYFLFDPNEEVVKPIFDPNFNESEVTLLKDFTPELPIEFKNGQSCTVMLNGKTLTGPIFAESHGEAILGGDSDSYVFWVKEGGDLVIEGEGKVEAQDAKYSMAVWAQGGKVTINGGEFYNHGDGCDLIYASNGGQVEIHGGEFHATERSGAVEGTQNKFSALNIKDKDRETSSIKVFGGKFFGFDPANNLSEGPETNFVAEGYKSVEVETGVWEVMPE